MYLKLPQEGQQRKRHNELLYRYGYFLSMLLCMIFASIRPHLGKTNGVFNGNIIIRYFAVPLTYLEAGLICDPKSLYLTLSNAPLLIFTMTFIYVLMPFLMRLGVCLLTYANVNVWLLKGMEVLYCMPPPFNTSIVLCRLAQADLSTSIVITLVSHFGGLFISPVLLYFVLGASTPPLVGVNVKETIYSTIIPLAIGIAVQVYILKYDFCFKIKSPWFSQGLLLATAYHWFCDAVSVDASSLQASDVLSCIVIACVGQLFVSCLCWILCSRWLPRDILLAALFTSTHKSVGLGSWVLRGAYHGSAHGPAVNLPLSILPVAQLLLGSLLASWLSP
ncbi:sodium/bile acid cotransporter 7 isoform X3 [Megalopta genalis]|uniref:sodium/bile acid cotransporter 7 isoform X3 n=1 Tax=Megalopta genalis TaxID=115081 RepID=UPI0014435226|nr:sodium/bile acid cotransporter 7-like isoform X1 [Megalopta genalis]XP_033332520.1 sodium/bile acid cotransporter 7-like isoform X1 [Megalopta genalis]XP_033332521.1 sodium/bile acid cotransporter 7-like isoform X1 [Megalopta genalis]XP_033332522.1 sodium/bile acid cotransporter 7-like isoform X1 [Megalopta genalis]XP_033332523.1 sodium/bile acid cotransporter 7-like isoform X1 [Megalopta genalis]